MVNYLQSYEPTCEIMPTIETDLPGLKRLGKELLDALPTANAEEVEAGWKCVSLAYLGVKLASKAEEVQAVALFKIISAKVLERTLCE